jgi:hypothetical protein
VNRTNEASSHLRDISVTIKVGLLIALGSITVVNRYHGHSVTFDDSIDEQPEERTHEKKHEDGTHYISA